jgi:hypothetical protein
MEFHLIQRDRSPSGPDIYYAQCLPQGFSVFRLSHLALIKLTEKRYCNSRRNRRLKVICVSLAMLAKMDDAVVGLVIDKMDLL